MRESMHEQMTLWGEMMPFFKLNEKPLILIELFAGIGAQRKALEILGVKIDEEKSKICEWAFNSYVGYNAIHIKDNTDYSEGMSKEELIAKIRGTSTNYNEPLTEIQLKKKSIDWLRCAYNNCKATHNLINIMDIKGSDLGELPKEQVSIMTYSFPCQDLSLGGHKKGMEISQAEGGTRSGLIWEVERILIEREREHSTLPTILLMENVPEVVGKNNIAQFKKWEHRLRQFGYSNYVEILNAKDYGIPQNRKRCFMISILGEYAYDFPCKIHLKYRLKHLLEKEVDKNYYLSQAMFEYLTGINQVESKYNRGEVFLRNFNPKKDVACTITTAAGQRATDNFVIEGDLFEIDFIPIKNATKKGYLEAEEGDGIDISGRMQYHRGTVQKGVAQTLTCQGGENVGVVIDENTTKRYKNYITWRNKKGEFNTECNRASLEDDISLTIPTCDITKVAEKKKMDDGTVLRIRKLTPKECIRLMGFSDKDYQALRNAGLSDSAIYHVAGDSIVTTCLVSIFSPLLNEKNAHTKIVENYVEKEIIEKDETLCVPTEAKGN